MFLRCLSCGNLVDLMKVLDFILYASNFSYYYDYHKNPRFSVFQTNITFSERRKRVRFPW